LAQPTLPLSNGVKLATALIAAPTSLLWCLLAAYSSSPTGGDAAGNAMAEGFAGLTLTAVWLGVGLLVLLAAWRGQMSPVGRSAGVLSIAVAGAFSVQAFELLFANDESSLLAPALVVDGAPLLGLLYALRALVPNARVFPETPTVAAICLAQAALCAIAASALATHQTKVDRDMAIREQWQRKFDGYGADTPLAQWLELLGGYGVRDAGAQALDRIRDLPRRQTEAEAMLDEGTIAWDVLPQINVEVTPRFCEKTRGALARKAEAMARVEPASRPYENIARTIASAGGTIHWLATWSCAADVEARAFASAAKLYRPDPPERADSWTERERRQIEQLGDPDEIRRILHNEPAVFALLTPESHLRAWLSFVNDENLREAALAGARKLRRRTGDMEEILAEPYANERSAWLLEQISQLDLSATPRLCARALPLVDREFGQAFRPTREDPTPFEDLMRGAGGTTVTALVWLASHGCDAGRELADAAAIVGAYQDSPRRTTMLANIDSLRRKNP
jgi:hypothetical protein